MGVGRGTEAREGFPVGRLIDAFDKEIARSVPFLNPVLAVRQLLENDSDMAEMSLDRDDNNHIPLTCPTFSSGAFPHSHSPPGPMSAASRSRPSNPERRDMTVHIGAVMEQGKLINDGTRKFLQAFMQSYAADRRQPEFINASRL
jgi:hypothetical protein